MAPRLWLTNRPCGRPGDVAHLAQALPLELGVADGQHLVDEQDLGLEVRGDGEREPDVHAARVALDRAYRESARHRRTRRSRRTSRMISRRSSREWRRSGRCSPGRSAPGGSPCRPPAACRRARARSARPSVGSVMRERIFSSVLLPAPLRPIRPTTSPCLNLEARRRAAPRTRSSSRSRRRRAPPRRSISPDALAEQAARGGSEHVALADALRADRDVAGHVRSRPRSALDARRSTAGRHEEDVPVAGTPSARARCAAPGRTVQRKASITPTSGLSE